jgi:lysophospholipase L1-like esterase
MSKKSVINLGLVFASVVLSLTIVEVALRAVGFKYDYSIKLVQVGEEWRDYHMYEDQMFEPDPLLLWKPRPSTNYWVPFNSKGYRGKEFDDDKDAHERRVLAIGDSNTLGSEFSWPGFLQETLDQGCPDTRWTVINAGVYGYTSFQGVIRFQEALKYHPDIVIASFGWNDAVETANKPDRFYGQEATRFMSIKRFLSTYFRTYHLLRAAIGMLSAEGADPNGGRYQARVPLEDYRANLEKIISISRQNHIMPILLTRPNNVGDVSHEVGQRRWRKDLDGYNDIIHQVGTRNQVPVLDVYAMFQGKGDAFIDDTHLKGPGLRTTAEKLTEIIQQESSPRSCPESN